MAARRGKKQARRSGGSAGTPGWVWLLVGLLIGGVVAVGVYMKTPRLSDNGLPQPDASAQPSKSTASGVAPEGSAPISPDTTAAAVPKTKFDFYTLLPEKEVVIPDEELSARVKAEAAAQAASKAQAAVPTTSAQMPSSMSSPATPANGGMSTATIPTATSPAANGPTAGSANATTAGLPSGTTPTTNASSTPATPSQGRYLLQAGAFRGGEQADDLKARIAMLGLVGRVEIVQTPNGPMHRVRLGPYATASELEQAKQKLGQGGMPAVAIRVK